MTNQPTPATASVFLIRINDRSWGFRVVALVADSEADAVDMAKDRFRCYFGRFLGGPPGHRHAELLSSCKAHRGKYVEMEFEE